MTLMRFFNCDHCAISLWEPERGIFKEIFWSGCSWLRSLICEFFDVVPHCWDWSYWEDFLCWCHGFEVRFVCCILARSSVSPNSTIPLEYRFWRLSSNLDTSVPSNLTFLFLPSGMEQVLCDVTSDWSSTDGSHRAEPASLIPCVQNMWEKCVHVRTVMV